MARLCLAFGLLVTVAAAGCSICATPFDYAYPAYGGKWERTDRFHGRVGSAFHPAGPMPGEVIEGTAEEIEAPHPATPPEPPMPPLSEDEMGLEAEMTETFEE